MESLVHSVLPGLIARRRGQRVLRVWSAGCSTGEELYTLSILLHEQIPDFESWTIDLVGTDIDDAVVRKARRAEYGERALRSTPEAARQRYFERVDKTFRVRPKFRQGVHFEVHNLVDPNAAPPAGGRFDLVMCRNVTIYFVASGLERITNHLACAMAEDGIWIAAPSDPKPPSRFTTRVMPGLLLNTLGDEAAEAEKAPKGPKKTGGRSDTLPATPSSKRFPQVAPPPVAWRPESRRMHEEPVAVPTPLVRRDFPEIGLAMQLANEGKVPAALELVGGVLAENPLTAEPHAIQATLLEMLGDVEGAMAALRRVIYLEPQKVEAHVRLSLLLQRIGDQDGAIRALRNATAAGAATASDDDAEYRVFAARHLMRLLAEEDK
jgi:chemotaxis protein methyltransferase CheR